MLRRFKSPAPAQIRLVHRACEQPPPLDAFSLLYLAEDVLGIKIELATESRLSLRMPALVCPLADRHYEIRYRSHRNRAFVQINLLHELAHLLLGHNQGKAVKPMMPIVYTTTEERQADWLAYRLMDFIVQYNENPIWARFVFTISDDLQAVPEETTDPRLGLEFLAFIDE
ncbi:MAG: ImmA/IrrE family metallo-endopeptidase [Candidatus Poribacteria bacterium]|nr:ImmA/IrrE family metallo-endopeptidase [Candidatus Poribacteria bacterium]